MTFNGAVVDCTFITAGASGRERCTKVSVATAILGSSLTEIGEVVDNKESPENLLSKELMGLMQRT